MYTRLATENIQIALADTPVVFLMGPRQSGKTTLIKNFIDESWEYITFDDQTQLKIALADPVGFVRNLPEKKSIVLDEIQRLPELFVSIKQVVDEQRIPGKFLLTGSANAMLLPRLSDSLAGRMESIRLAPLSEYEILGRKPSFLKKLLSLDTLSTQTTRIRDYLLERLVAGCFPEPIQRTSPQRRSAWYQQYVTTLVQRDLQELSTIDDPDRMSKLIRLIAYYSSKLINITEIGQKVGLDRYTVSKYIALLEQIFLVEQLPAWHTNEYKRLVKTPKIHIVDTGLSTAIRGMNESYLIQHPTELGHLLETFVYNEIRKQAYWEEEPLAFYHYRDKDKEEVDIVIENARGDCFGIEVKAAATLNESDFTGLKRLQRQAGDHFKRGVLLYDGDHTTAFGNHLFAVPIAALWE